MLMNIMRQSMLSPDIRKPEVIGGIYHHMDSTSITKCSNRHYIQLQKVLFSQNSAPKTQPKKLNYALYIQVYSLSELHVHVECNAHT